MCLINPTGKFTILKSKEDVTCYKVLAVEDGALATPYTHTDVNINDIKRGKPFVATGYKGLLKRKNKIFKDFVTGIYAIREGAIHTYRDLEDAKNADRIYFSNNGIDIVIFECVIPKGTNYVEGYAPVGRRGYCSPKIVFKKVAGVIDNGNWNSIYRDDLDLDDVEKTFFNIKNLAASK